MACRERPAAEPAAPEYMPTATIKDLMKSMIDPSADVVWNSVTSVSTAKGLEENAPKTPEEWELVRQAAIRLIEAPNLLVMPGRHVARPGEKSEAPGVELEPSQMEELINKDRASFQARAKALHDVGLEALQAVEARDAARIVEAGDHMEMACENCHMNYWYPNQKIPDLPRDMKPYGR
jgi:hypothetical protein